MTPDQIRERIKEARGLVEKAAPGPWHSFYEEDWPHRLEAGEWIRNDAWQAIAYVDDNMDLDEDEGTNRLIASAPSLVSNLCDIIEELLKP